MSPDDFYSRFLDALVPRTPAASEADGLVRPAERRDRALPDPGARGVAGHVVGRIADGRIIPLTAEDAEA